LTALRQTILTLRAEQRSATGIAAENRRWPGRPAKTLLHFPWNGAGRHPRESCHDLKRLQRSKSQGSALPRFSAYLIATANPARCRLVRVGTSDMWIQATISAEMAGRQLAQLVGQIAFHPNISSTKCEGLLMSNHFFTIHE